MNVSEWLSNEWFISIASIVIALILEPILIKSLEFIRALYGVHSGTYIGITGSTQTNSAVIELVKCQHVGNRLKGTITGVSFAELQGDYLVELAQNNGKYRFNGSVDERVFVISYQTTLRGARGLGTIILKGDSSGKVFTGIWGGYDDDQIVDSPCTWMKVNKELQKSLNDKEVIFKEVKKLLFIDKGAQHGGKTAYLTYLTRSGGMGKTLILKQLADIMKHGHDPHLEEHRREFIANMVDIRLSPYIPQDLLKSITSTEKTSNLDSTGENPVEEKKDDKAQNKADSEHNETAG